MKHCVEKIESNILKHLENTLERENSLNTTLHSKPGLSNTRNICLSILGPNSYCGIDDLFNGKTVRETTAKCISPTSTIYAITKEVFFDPLIFY